MELRYSRLCSGSNKLALYIASTVILCSLIFQETLVSYFVSSVRFLGLTTQLSGTVLDNVSMHNAIIFIRNYTMYQRQNGRNQTYEIQMIPKLEKMFNTTLYPVTVDKPFLLENPELCSSVDNLTMVVTVNSAPYHFAHRAALRRTWTNGSFYEYLGINIRTVFLLGRTNSTVQQKVTEEFKKYGDIVQGDFVDYYYNLTHKSVMGYKWLSERCRNAQFVLKVDDDMLVNVFRLFLVAFREKSLPNTDVFCDRNVGMVNRNPESKWYVRPSLLKGHNNYLPFCKGKFVWINNKAIPPLFKAASNMPFFHLDDVLVYGYVMHCVQGLAYTNLALTEWTLKAPDGKRCLLEKTTGCPYMLLGTQKPEQILTLWQIILKLYKSDMHS